MIAPVVVAGGMVAGDKLVKPLNAPPAGAASPGVQPGSSGGVTLAHYVIVYGAGGGVFVYNGQPGNGNPPMASVTDAPADPYGNPVKPGITSYSNDSNGTFTQVNGGLTVFGNNTYPTVAKGAFGFNISPAGALQVFTGDSGGFIFNQNATMQMSAGNYLVASNPATGLEETWHPMTLLNSWAVDGIARYQLMPDNTVMVEGTQLVPGTVTGGTSIWTPPAGYVPTTTQRLELIIENSTGSAGVETPRLDMTPTGLEVFNIPASTTRVGFTGRYSLN